MRRRKINYVSPEIGQTVDSDQWINLPAVATNSRGRSPFLLAKLLPGVIGISRIRIPRSEM